MKEDNLYRPHQSLYQMRPGSAFGDSNPLVSVHQDSYQFSKKGRREEKRAVGGPLGTVPAPVADSARDMRNSSNLPPVTLKRGGPMKHRKEHMRRVT